MAEPTIHYDGPLVTHEEAKGAGLTRYFTAKPCPSGHVAQRMVSSRGCVACLAVTSAARAKTPEERKKRAEYQARRRATEEALRERRTAEYKAYKAERQRERRRKIHEVREQEAGRPKPKVCEICRTVGRWVVWDHCHSTGKFRGWLCDKCNLILGQVNDSPKLLRRMAKYLEDNRHGRPDGQKEEEITLFGLRHAG